MINSILSFFQGPVRNKQPLSICTIRGIHRYVTEDPWLQQVTRQVRMDLDKPEIFKLKKLTMLPYVTAGGVFSRCCKSGLMVPSGDFVVDIDHLDSAEEARRLRDLLAQDPLLQPDLAFVSPSGRGVKLFVPYRIDPGLPLDDCFRQAIQASWTYLEVTYGVQPDRANTDICRGCLLCHDPQARSFSCPQTTLENQSNNLKNSIHE